MSLIPTKCSRSFDARSTASFANFLQIHIQMQKKKDGKLLLMLFNWNEANSLEFPVIIMKMPNGKSWEKIINSEEREACCRVRRLTLSKASKAFASFPPSDHLLNSLERKESLMFSSLFTAFNAADMQNISVLPLNGSRQPARAPRTRVERRGMTLASAKYRQT